MHTPLRTITLVICLSLSFLALSSCASNIPLHTLTDPVSLPTAAPIYVAPIGDAALEYSAEVTLFLPRHQSTRLASITQTIPMTAAKPQTESIVRALLNYEGDGLVSPVGGTVKLSLYGANPVESSRNVVTVNLAASALQLDRKAFYLACQAIANTLTTLPGIDYVNVLVMDKKIGLDIASTLPMGTLGRSVGQDLGAVYEQLLSQRPGPNADPASNRFTALTTLYFPLMHVDGLMPETRSVTFDGLAFPDMVAKLLAELAIGPQQPIRSPALPLLADMLTSPPVFSDTSEGGGKMVSLHFDHHFDEMLTAVNLNRASCMASITYTLSTFLPGLNGVTFYIGEDRVENVLLRDPQKAQIALLFNQAVQSRADYAPFLMDIGELYFADDSGTKLLMVERPMPYYLVRNPRALLLELARGPQGYDNVPSYPIMAAGALKDSDLVGFSLSSNTLLVNFAPTFALVGQGFSKHQDRLLAYGLVNTLTCISRIRQVSFFVAGETPTGFSGDIYWAGDFYQNMGLVRQAP